MRGIGRPWVIGILLAGCAPAPAPPVTPTAVVPTGRAPGALPAPADPEIVSVVAARVPAKLSIDGDLREWGSLLPPGGPALRPPPEPETPGAAEKDESGEAAPEPPNPREAASHLAFALSGDAVSIAAELGEPAREGIWLGIGSAAPSVPPIGEYSRGGRTRDLECHYRQIESDGLVRNGEPNPPETVAACLALIERYQKQVAAHEARFERLFKVDREGVRAVAADGALVAIEGAKAVFQPGAKGATVEVSLPVTALPRVAEAPLAWLRLWARAASAPKPSAIPRAQWVWVNLPNSVSFEPYGELRARAFKALVGHTYFPPGLSYQPGDALRLESVRHPEYEKRNTVVAREETLYRKLGSVGEVEVGYVSAYGDGFAIFKNGKLIDAMLADGDYFVDIMTPPTVQGVATRDGELHVFTYSPQQFTEMYGQKQASWWAFAVAADGSHREDLVDYEVDQVQWEDAWPFASPKFDSFGVRGTTHYGGGIDYEKKLSGMEIGWRWDPKQKRYLGKARRIPVPKKGKT